jgi:nitrilase
MLQVALAQIAPVWLDKEKTLEKIDRKVRDAGEQGCNLVVFGEALVSGYPFWLEHTGGATFNSPMQKQLYAHYARNAVQLERGDLDPICRVAREKGTAVYLGIIERPPDRGGHSLYCSLVYIDPEGKIGSVHRKLRPTYDERLVWSAGDGHGLRVHSLEDFTVGGLNCWENWMPLPRAALYGMGENCHIAVWPGSARNTSDITRFIAREARSFVISVSGLMRLEDIPENTPYYREITGSFPDMPADGGSCVAGPDGQWLVEPVVGKEAWITVTLEVQRVLEERQNFDPSGHYSRPDVTRLSVNRERQTILRITDDEPPASGSGNRT